jgi:hypothetical protein
MPDLQVSPDLQETVHPEVRYEKSDARIGSILLFAGALVGLGLLVHGVSAWLFHGLSTGQAERPRPKLVEQRPQLPRDIGKIPAPVLQQSEGADMQALRHKEHELLNTYGWVDPKKNIVRIPVAEAMRLLATDRSLRDAHGLRVDATKEKE